MQKMQLMDWMEDHLKAGSCGYKWPNMTEIQWEKLEEADETDQDLGIDGEDLEVGLGMIEEEEGHILEADLEATNDREEEIHAVDLEVKDKDPPPETETDQDPNLVPDQDQEIEQHLYIKLLHR